MLLYVIIHYCLCELINPCTFKGRFPVCSLLELIEHQNFLATMCAHV